MSTITKQQIGWFKYWCRIHHLPYHKFGEDKYKGLGRDYLMAGIDTMPDAHIEKLKSVVEETGLICRIGG